MGTYQRYVKSEKKEDKGLSTFERFQKNNPEVAKDRYEPSQMPTFGAVKTERTDWDNARTQALEMLKSGSTNNTTNSYIKDFQRSTESPVNINEWLADSNTPARLAEAYAREQEELKNRDYAEKPVNMLTDTEKAALKKEYESIPETNAFQRLWNQGVRATADLYNVNLRADYPDYGSEYERKQELSKNYNEIKEGEAYKALLDHGFTDEYIRMLNSKPLSTEEIKEYQNRGMSDEEIAEMADKRSQLQADVRRKFEDLMATVDESWGVTVDDITNMLYHRSAIPEIERDTAEHPVVNSLYTLASNPVESAIESLANIGNYASGKPMQNYQTTTETVRNEVTNSIDSQLGKTIYGGAMSIGDTAVATGLAYATGGGSIVSAGVQALEKAAQVMGEGVDRNLTPDQIFAEGIASGVTTYLTEKIPMGMAEKVVENGLTNYSAREIGKYLGSMFITEGLQEGFEDVADWAADAAIAWDKNEFNTEVQELVSQGMSKKDAVTKVVANRAVEMFTDIVIGGISGAHTGATSTTLAYYLGKVNNNPSVYTNKILNSPKAFKEMLDAVNSIDTSNLEGEDLARVEHAKEVAQEIANKPKKQIKTEEIVDIANVLNEQADSENNLARTINNINYQASYDTNLQEYDETKKITPAEGETDIEKAARKEAESLAVRYEKAQQEADKARQKLIDNEIKNFEKNIRTNNLDAINNAAEGFENETAAKNFKENYRGQNPSLYTESSYLAYRAGESRQNFDNFLKNSQTVGFALSNEVVTEDYLKTLYYNGLNARTNENEEITLRDNENRGKATGLVPEDQLAEFKKRVAKKLGIEVATDRIDATSRGHFSANLAKLTVNATADNEYAAILHEMFEFARAYNKKGMDIAERTLVNIIAKKSGEEKFVNAVMAYREAYRKAGRNAPKGSSLSQEANKNFSEAQEEFINDAVSYIFSSDEGMKVLVDYIMSDEDTTSEQKVSTIQAIKDWVDHLIQTIKNFITGHKTKQYGYTFTEGLKLSSEELESISRMLTGVLDEARENLAKQTKVESKESGKETVDRSVSTEVFRDSEDRNIYNFAEDAINKRIDKDNKIVISDRISDKAGEDIFETIGVDAKGYKNTLIAERVQHIWDRHGIHGTSDHSMANIHDIAQIEYVVDNYDGMTKGKGQFQFKNKDNTYADTVLLWKKMDDEYYYVVEAVPDTKKKTLYVVTAYKNNASPEVLMPNGLRRDARNELQSDAFISDSNIAESEEKSNTQDLEKIKGADTAEGLNPGTAHSHTLSKNNVTYSKEKSNQQDVEEKKNFSLNVPVEDSEGHKLSKGQQDYFKDSKIRDENGNLLKVYHGSMADFTVFDLGEARDSEDIEAFFFSPVSEEAEGYGNTRAFYLNITNPADFDTAYDIFFKHRKENPAGAGSRTREELIKLGYDGVAAIDSTDPEYPEYLAFYPEQIKLVSNTKPTKNEDIRFSIDVRYNEAYENNDISEMDALVEQAARAAGYDSPKLYHGTGTFGFTQFDLSKMDDKSTVFLTSNPEIASTYSGSRRQKNITERFNKDIDSLTNRELVEALNENTPDDGTDSKYEYYDAKKIAKLEKQNEESISEIMTLIQEAEKSSGYEDSKAKKNIDEVKTLIYLNSKEKLLHDEEINKRLGARLWFLSQTDAGNILDSSIRERFKEIEEDYRKASTLSKKEAAAILESSMDGYIYEAYTQEEARKLLSENVGRGIYSLYAKLGKSMIVDANGKNWNDLSKVWVKGYTSQFNADNTILERENGEISLYSEDGDLLGGMKENDYTDSRSDEEIKNHLLDGIDYTYSIRRSDIETTRDIAKFAKQHGFDSVIFKNIRDNGGRNSDVNFDEKADVYALFNPNDIKSADPITYDDEGGMIPPSERFKNDKEDIRFSLAVPVTDSEGRKLSKGQQRYFEKSLLRDNNGNLKVMYHGTERGGFTVFDPEFSDDGISLFFTDDKNIAKAYSGTDKEINLYRTVKDLEELIHDSYTHIEKDGDAYRIINGFDDDAETEFEGTFDELKEYVEEQYGVEEATNYKVYLNAENPLVIDAKGNNWDEIPEVVKGLTTTREYAVYAKDNGYDSVIINNVVDSGVNADSSSRYKNTQVVIVFDSNQVKSIYNENPTEKEDIRFSIDVSDPFMDSFLEVDEEVKKTESQLKDMIDKQMDLDSDISKKMISEVASYIKKRYNSNYKKELLEKSITAVFKYLQGNNATMDDILMIMSDITKPVLQDVKATDPELEKLYKDFVSKVKTYKIALDPGQRQEVANSYGTYKNYMDSMRGKITLDKKGTPLDDIWTEICDASGGMLSYGTVPNDQPIALADLINALNPTYSSLEGQALEDASMDAALEIIRQFYVRNSLTGAAETVKGELSKRAAKFKEEYKKRYNDALKQVEAERSLNMQRLAEEIDNLTAEQQEAIRTGDTINQALIENLKRDYQRRYDRLRAESIEKIARAKAQYQNAWINKNLKRERSDLKNRLLREVKALQNIIAHPQEGATKHVPVNLIKPTIEMLEAINLDNGGSNKAIVERLKKMSEVYESFKNDDTYSFDYDDRIANDIKELQEMFEKRSYADLGITELERVIEIVTALKTQIKNANNLILQGKLKDAKEAADNAMNHVRASRRYDNAAMNLLNRYGNIHLNAYREFRKLSGYDEGALMDIYRDLDDGSKREMQIQKDLGAIFADVLEGRENQKEVKRFISPKKEDLVDIGITDRNGKPILITRAMRMSLIMHSMNEGNMRHILGSGITVPNMYYFEKGKLDEAYAKGTNYRFVDYMELLDALQKNNTAKIEELSKKAQERIENLKNDLSQWEKDFLADAEEMFHEETGKLINDTSMKLKGYALARVKNYFPIKTDAHFTQKEWSGLVRDGSLEGMGMLKERVISTKPILLEDITNVIQRQIRSVSKYAGYAVPVRNFETIMKQTTRNQSTGQLHNLFEVIDSVWGASDTKWLQNLMQDIQGGRSEKGNFLMNLRGQFAGATLTLNLPVAIKQAASYPTAAAVLGWKPLGRAMADIRNGFAGKGIEELEKINPLLWYRNQGNATQELADAKAVGFGKNLPLWLQKAVNWTQWFDTGTVRTLEYASMYYVDENFKELEKGSEKYWKAVSEVFTNVVEQTQPNYSTLHKADIIRNPNSFVKMLVMFKTQPMQNFGIIYDAMGELNAAKASGNKKWIDEASSNAARAISSQAVSATVFSAMNILSQLILHRWWKYRDDEGKWSWEKLMAALGEGIISCFTGAFIGGSELYEALKHIFTGDTYYGIEVSVAEMVNDFVDNVGNLTKNAKTLSDAKTSEDREKATQKLLKASINLGSTIGEFEGTPVNNIKNMLSSMYFYATDIIRSIDEGELSISDDSNIAQWDIKNQYQRIYEAMRTGDTEKYNKLVQELINDAKADDLTDEEVAAKVEKTVTDKVMNLMKAEYLEGDITEEEMSDFLVEEKGKTEDEAYFQMRKWSTGESSDYGTMKNLVSTASEDPTPENRKAVTEEVENLVAHGKKKEDVAKTITNTFKEEYVELYENNNAADLNSILRSALVAAGYTDDQAKKKLEGWVK